MQCSCRLLQIGASEKPVEARHVRTLGSAPAETAALAITAGRSARLRPLRRSSAGGPAHTPKNSGKLALFPPSPSPATHHRGSILAFLPTCVTHSLTCCAGFFSRRHPPCRALHASHSATRTCRRCVGVHAVGPHFSSAASHSVVRAGGALRRAHALTSFFARRPTPTSTRRAGPLGGCVYEPRRLAATFRRARHAAGRSLGAFGGARMWVAAWGVRALHDSLWFIVALLFPSAPLFHCRTACRPAATPRPHSCALPTARA
jgi:hypothetical protein